MLPRRVSQAPVVALYVSRGAGGAGARREVGKPPGGRVESLGWELGIGLGNDCFIFGREETGSAERAQ